MTQNEGRLAEKNSVRHFLKRWGWWAVPIVLYASSFVWSIPLREKSLVSMPLFVLQLGQIVGIICSFLLGVWFMNVFRRDTIFGRASVGMLGIGMAIAIFSCLINRPIPWYYVAGIQLIWLIYVAIIHRNDKSVTANRELIAQFDRVRMEVFGRAYVLIGWVALKGMGFMAYTLMACLGWIWIQVPFFEQNPVLSRFLWFEVGCGISAAAIFVLLPVWMGHINIEVRYLTNPPKTPKQIIMAILESSVELILYGLFIMFWIVLNPTILSIGTFLLLLGYGFVLYFWMYRACIPIESKQRLGKLRTLYSDHFDTLNNVFGRPVWDRVQPTEEGLKAVGVRGEVVYPWESIVHLYFRSLKSMRIVNKQDGSEIRPLILSGLKSKARVEAIIQQWGKGTEGQIETMEFVYPQTYQLQDEQRHRLTPYGILVSSIMMIGVGIGFIVTWENPNHVAGYLFNLIVIVFLVLTGPGFLLYAIYSFRNKPKILNKIKIDSANIFVEYLDGSWDTYPCKDVKRCHYFPETNGYRLSFANGDVVGNIDKVSYFGVLKRRLDAMMAQKEQISSVEDRT